MSSVDDIMAVLLEAPSTNNTSTTNSTSSTPKSTSSKPGRGRPATRSANKQINSSITITSKPERNITISSKPTNTKPQRASSAQQKELENKENKVVEETKQVGKREGKVDKVNKQMENKMAKENKTTGKKQQLQEMGAWHTSRLELEFVKVKTQFCFTIKCIISLGKSKD